MSNVSRVRWFINGKHFTTWRARAKHKTAERSINAAFEFFYLGTRPISEHYMRNGLRRHRKAATVRRAQGHRTLIRLRQKRPRSSASSSSSSLIVIYDKQRARVGRKSVRRSLGPRSVVGGHRPENCPMRKEGGAAARGAAMAAPPSLAPPAPASVASFRPLFFTRSPPLLISLRRRKRGHVHFTRISSSKGDLPAGRWTQCRI